MVWDSSFWHTYFPEPNKAYEGSNLPEVWIQNLFRHKLLKIWVPQSLGGLECNFQQGLIILEQAAAHQGSLGWLINLGSGTNYFGPDFSPDLARETFAPTDAWLAGSGRPSGTLVKEGDAWFLSGQWPWCTGAAQASCFTLNACLPGGGITSVVLPAQGLIKHRHWPYAGLHLTSSWEVEAKHLQVHPRQFFCVGKRQAYDWPLSTLDFNDFASLCMRASWLGMLRGFLECSHPLAAKKPSFARILEKLSHSHSSAFNLVLQAADAFENKPEVEFSSEGLNPLLKEQRQLVMEAFWHGGTSMAHAERPWYKAWMDLLLCGQHTLLA